MSLRKSGSRNFGFVPSGPTGSPQSLSAGALTIAVIAVAATIIVSTPGIPVPVPFVRPVAQRGIRFFGPTAPSTTPPTGGAQTLTAGNQTIAISAPTAIEVSGPITLSAGSQTLAISAPTATLSGAGTPGVSVPVPFMRPVAQRTIRFFGPTAPSTTPPTTGPQTLQAGSQTLAISAPTAVLASAGVSSSPALLRFQGATVHHRPSIHRGLIKRFGVITQDIYSYVLAADIQIVTVSAPTATLTTPSTPGVSVPITFQRPYAQRGIRTFGPTSPSVSPGSPQTLSAGSQTVAISAPTAVRVATITLSGNTQTVAISAPVATRVAVLTLASGSQTLAISAPTVSLSGTGGLLSAGVQTVAISAPTVRLALKFPIAANTVAISAPTATLNIAGGAQTLQAGIQTLAISAPAPTVTTTLTLASGRNTVAISAPAASVSLATIRAAGIQAVAITAPVATLRTGAVAASAGIQTVAISAPTAVRLATISRAAGANIVAISAPIASLSHATPLVQAGVQTLAITAPPVRILGAITLPDDMDTFLESRVPTRDLARRSPTRLLEARNGDRLVEYGS